MMSIPLMDRMHRIDATPVVVKLEASILLILSINVKLS
jgi:hypothetical protein